MRFLKTSLIVFLCAFSAGSAYAADALMKMNLEELLNMEVTSVSKVARPFSQSPAALFVLTGEDVRRSGATTLPDLLRLVPGVHVAQLSSSSWAVTARGFNGSLANKLLVLIDGRSVYTPLYAGVYWDVQDVILEDIERIEVIRGPGAALWGSNAVNGVINVITKSAERTKGTLASVTVGTEERFTGQYRYGRSVGEDAAVRVFGKYADRDASSGGNDAWDLAHGGFRADWQGSAENDYTLQGDYYNGEADRRATLASAEAPFVRTMLEDEQIAGGNVLWRWTHKEDARHHSALQAYYDQTFRDQTLFAETRHTFDLDWQKSFALSERQQLTWGAGYRLMADETDGSFGAFFEPQNSTDQLFSAFVQDEIVIVPERVTLALGAKFERNDYSGFEVQPSSRAAWNVDDRQTVWAAVSRAVRIPTRLDHHLQLAGWLAPGTSLARVFGDSTVRSEEVLAYEAGYRVMPSDTVSIDATVFFNDYDNLQSVRTASAYSEGVYTVLPFYLDDTLQGETYGTEIYVQYRATSRWKLTAGYTHLRTELHGEEGVLFAQGPAVEGQNPKNQVQLGSKIDVTSFLEFDAQVRYVDSLVSRGTGSYVELDLRLGWHVDADTELSLVGRNLLDNQHPEFTSDVDPLAPQTERSVYAKIVRRF